jgi:hypothetical protein
MTTGYGILVSRESYTTAEESSNFLLEIMTLVSSANIMGSDEIFIVGGRSFIYIYIEKQGP